MKRYLFISDDLEIFQSDEVTQTDIDECMDYFGIIVDIQKGKVLRQSGVWELIKK